MPDASNTFATFGNVGALGAGTEVVVASDSLVGVKAGSKVVLRGTVNVLQGAAAGSLTLKFRRGGLTGAQVASQAGYTLAIAESKSLALTTTDIAPSDDPVYSFTVIDSTAATGNAGSIEGQPAN